jgi:hypothetical protein
MYIETSTQEQAELGYANIECNWGTHFCGLYSTDAERDEILLGFVEKGFEQSNSILCSTFEQSKEEFIFKLRNSTQDNAINDFNYYTAHDLYYPNDKFSPDDMNNKLEEFYKFSQKDGKKYVRGTAEMSWVTESLTSIEKLMAYEANLNRFIKGKPWISVCLYNVTKFSGEFIMNVLKTHPYCISGKIVTINPFYEQPEIWLRQNAPEYL